MVSAPETTRPSEQYAAEQDHLHSGVGSDWPGLTDRGKLWCVRLTVMALSVVAYLLSVTSNRIHDLVETASAFGSAGVFVTALFALFTRFGGAASAYASVATGMLVWAAGKYAAGLAAPYLLGLLAALVAYVSVAVLERAANEQSFRKRRPDL